MLAQKSDSYIFNGRCFFKKKIWREPNIFKMLLHVLNILENIQVIISQWLQNAKMESFLMFA